VALEFYVSFLNLLKLFLGMSLGFPLFLWIIIRSDDVPETVKQELKFPNSMNFRKADR